MRIAPTTVPGRVKTDRLLAAAGARLASQALRAAGNVQFTTDRERADPCYRDLKALPDAAMIRVSQDLTSMAKGCRLDTVVSEAAAVRIGARNPGDAEVLIDDEFGKPDAEGRVLHTFIGETREPDIPALIGGNALNFDAFSDFTCGLAAPMIAAATGLGGRVLARLATRTGPDERLETEF